MTVFLTIVRYRIKFNLALLLLSLWAINCHGQLNYTRNVFSGSYSTLNVANGGIQITPGTGTGNFSTTTGAPNMDDATAYIPLPFDFNFAGNTFTTNHYLGVSTNGFVYFSTTNTNFSKVSIFDNMRGFTTQAPNNCLYPWWDDLKLDAVGTNPAGKVFYKYCNKDLTNDDTLIVQYTDVSSSFTTTSGQPKQLNFQIYLYKNTGVIEFRYGAALGSTYNQSGESASIGIENSIGGVGNFMDGITGSKQLGTSMLNSKHFPTFCIRFTPGTPTPLAAGNYTVGKNGMFKSLNNAMAEINHRGVAGNIVFQLIDSLYDETNEGGKNIFPLMLENIVGTSPSSTVTFEAINGVSKIRSFGCTSNNALVLSPTTYNFINLPNEPILGLFGADYTSFKNLCFAVPDSNQRVDRGIWINNITATDGATNNVFENVEIKLNRDNNGSTAIYASTQYVPITATGGANSCNKFFDIKISNCAHPINIIGTNAYPDSANMISTKNCTTFNCIGGEALHDIGNDDDIVYGIKAMSQKDFEVSNTIVRNITSIGAYSVDGICIENSSSQSWSSGTIKVFNNKIYGLRNTNTNGGKLCAIKVNVSPNSAVRIYNNWICNNDNATLNIVDRQLIGIATQASGTANNVDYYISHNNINMNPVNAGCSNACIELGTKNNITHTITNNILSNKTTAQNGGIYHAIYYSPGNYSMGLGTFNYNCFYIEQSQNGYYGATPIGQFSTKANWDANITGPGPEQNSIYGNPQFANDNNNLSAAFLDLLGAATTPSVWITADINCALRTAPHCIGANIITGCSGLPEAGTAVASNIAPCYGTAINLSLSGNNYGPGISIQWQKSPTGSHGTFADIVGATAITYQAENNTVTNYFRCIVACTNSGFYDSTNVIMVSPKPLPSATLTTGTKYICQPANLSPLQVFAFSTQGVVSILPQTGVTKSNNLSYVVAPTTSTVYTMTVAGNNGCTRTASLNVVVSRSVYLNEVTATPANVCKSGSSVLSVEGGTTQSYNVKSIPFQKLTGVRGTVVFPLNNNNDYKEIPLPDKFEFDFFGKYYTKLYVMINGFVSFDAGSTFRYAQSLPSNNKPNGVIALFQSDLMVSNGKVDTFTIGLKPNRKFVISYDSLQLYLNGNSTGYASGQIVLIESVNLVECHIERLENGNINSRTKTTGIENSDGSVGVGAPGRNDADYTVTTPEGWRFVPSGGSITYTWKASPNLSSLTSPVVTASNLQLPEQFTVTAIDTSGCSKPRLLVVGVSNLSNSIVAPTTVCEGTGTTLNAEPSSGIQPYNYLWSNGQVASSLSLTMAATSTYTVTVTDAYGCSKSTSQTIAVLPQPVLNLTSNSPVCAGSTLELNANGNDSYTWNGPMMLATGSYQSVSNAQQQNAGVYDVLATGANGCTATATIIVEIAASDIPQLTSNMPVLQGDSLQLYCTSANAYAWAGPNNFSSTEQNPIVANFDSSMYGWYDVTVTYGNGCTSSNSIEIRANGSRMSSLVISSPSQNVGLVPNPVSNQFILTHNLVGAVTITIYDMYGKLLGTSQYPSTASTVVDVSNFSPGNYVVKISNGDVEVHKVFTKISH